MDIDITEMKNYSRIPEYDVIQKELEIAANDLFKKYAPEDVFMI